MSHFIVPSNNFLKLAKLYGDIIFPTYTTSLTLTIHISTALSKPLTWVALVPCRVWTLLKKWTKGIELEDIWKLSTIKLAFSSWVFIRQHICKSMLKKTLIPLTNIYEPRLYQPKSCSDENLLISPDFEPILSDTMSDPGQ